MKKLLTLAITCMAAIILASCNRGPAGGSLNDNISNEADQEGIRKVTGKETPRPSAPSVLEPSKLYNEYKAKRKEAAMKFYGRMLTLTTKPGMYLVDCKHKMIIFELGQGTGGKEGIKCRVLPDQCNAAANPAIAHEVRITGRCQGFDGAYVVLEQCIVSTK